MEKNKLEALIKSATGKGSRNLRKVWDGEMTEVAAKCMLTVNEPELRNHASEWLIGKEKATKEETKNKYCSKEPPLR